MNNEQLIKDIDEIIMTNRVARQFAGTEMAKDSLRKSNDVLSKARIAIKNKDGGYEKGLNDAWELAQRIGGASHPGYWDADELDEIFGMFNTNSIFDRYSYQEALAKVEEYEKKKAEEAAKLVPGDVVKVVNNGNNSDTYYGVYLGAYDITHYVMEKDCGAPSCFSTAHFTLEKIGQHVDLEGWTLHD